MRRTPILAAVPFALLLPALPLCAQSAETDAERAFAAQRDAILPAAHERAWRAVAWLPELRVALAEGDRAGKPVLLWAMNGHPLGHC